MIFFRFSLLTLLLLSCQPIQPTLVLPQLQSVASPQQGTLALTFDVEVQLEIIELDPRLTLIACDPRSIQYEGGEPGTLYALQAKAKKGLASLRFNTYFYDTNPSPATVQLNEIAIIHDKTRSNAVELLVTGSGNMGGITLLVGHNPDEAPRFVFPSKEVHQGQYLVVDVRTLQGEFHFAEAPGIPNTRGIIALMNSPYGPINQVFVYERSDRQDSASSQKDQFDTWHAKLEAQELWHGTPFDNRYVTATRSANRVAGRLPPYYAGDWYTTITKGLSLGQPNNPERFKPKS